MDRCDEDIYIRNLHRIAAKTNKKVLQSNDCQHLVPRARWRPPSSILTGNHLTTQITNPLPSIICDSQ